MTITISAERQEPDEFPPATHTIGVGPTATVQQIDIGLHGTVKQLNEPLMATVTKVANIGRWNLCSSASGGRSLVAIDLIPEEKESKRTKSDREEVEKSLDEIWEKAKTLIPENAQSLRVVYNPIPYIAYTVIENGESRMVRMGESDVRASSTGIFELMKEVRVTGKALWKLGNGGDSSGIRSDKPFEIVTEKWKKAHPTTLGQFMSCDFSHMETIAGDRKDHAFSRVAATEVYIQTLCEKVSVLKKRKKDAIQQGENLPKLQKQQLQKALEELERFENRLLNLDRYPIYWAAGLYDSTKNPYESAEEISDGVQLALQSKLRPGVDDRGLATRGVKGVAKFIGFSDLEGEGLRGSGPFVKAYADDAGDLIFDDPLKLIARIDDQGRRFKGRTIEGLITSNLIHLDKEDFDVAASLNCLEMTADEELTQAFRDARSAAKTEKFDGSTIAERLEALKKTKYIGATA